MRDCYYNHLQTARESGIVVGPQRHKAHKNTVLELYVEGKVSVVQAVNAGARLLHHRAAYRLAQKQRRALVFRAEVQSVLGRRVRA